MVIVQPNCIDSKSEYADPPSLGCYAAEFTIAFAPGLDTSSHEVAARDSVDSCCRFACYLPLAPCVFCALCAVPLCAVRLCAGGPFARENIAFIAPVNPKSTTQCHEKNGITMSHLVTLVDWLIIAGSGCAIVVLIVLIACIRHTRFRQLVMRGLAIAVVPYQHLEDSRWNAFRRLLATWLNGSTRTGEWSHGEQSSDDTTAREIDQDGTGPVPQLWNRAPALSEHAIDVNNKAYQTSSSSCGTQIIKRAINANGDRVLKKEMQVLRRLHRLAGGSSYDTYLPEIVDGFQSHSGQVNVFAKQMDSVFSAVQIRELHVDGLDGRHVAWMFNRMLEVIGFASKHGVVHCGVMPQHLLFDCETHGLQLVDWTHAKRPGQPVLYLPKRYRRWYPIERALVAQPSLDIYMASLCAWFLAGGEMNQFVHDAAYPKTLPIPIGQFLRSCLLPSARLRPNDAWQVHEEFRDLLGAVYGTPKFCSLSMSH